MTDPYVDDSGTLHNLLGITDPVELQRAEHEYTYLRLAELARNPLPGEYDLEHLRRFHRVIFQDVYSWAGELRTVDLAKNDDLFCLARYIESASGDVFARVSQVRADLSQRGGRIPVSMADLYGDINALHPFREGNGRAQRAFLAQLAGEHDTRLNWARLDPTSHIEASIAAQRGDTRGLLAALRIAGSQPVPDDARGWAARLATR